VQLHRDSQATLTIQATEHSSHNAQEVSNGQALRGTYIGKRAISRQAKRRRAERFGLEIARPLAVGLIPSCDKHGSCGSWARKTSGAGRGVILYAGRASSYHLFCGVLVNCHYLHETLLFSRYRRRQPIDRKTNHTSICICNSIGLQCFIPPDMPLEYKALTMFTHYRSYSTIMLG
jgi:hypothetical protein